MNRKQNHSLIQLAGMALLALSFAAQGAASTSVEARYAEMAKLHEALLDGKPVTEWQGSMKKAAKVSRDFWTLSQNYDEMVKKQILDPKVLSTMGVPVMGSVPGNSEALLVSAGLMHTYGYMVAQLKTAFGLKGKRWIEAKLDKRLGLTEDLFSPDTKSGEFLSNVTYALYVAFPDADPNTKARKQLLSAAKELKTLKATDFHQAGTLTELVTIQSDVKTSNGHKKILTVKTRFLRLKDLPSEAGPATADTYLLVYEVGDPGENWSRWVTAFPVATDFMEKIKASPAGAISNFKPRYNWTLNPGWSVVSAKNLGFTPDLLRASE